ncbi:MAG: hypothetical protein IKF14_14695 [Atopobiaceae bacterium]|nr:hypothetical protein [Atopobiaceae bacterium]
MKAGTEGHGKRFEAVQVVLKAKGSSATSASFKGAKRTTLAKFIEA